MAFRADESAKNGNERALLKLTSRELNFEQRIIAKDFIERIIEKYGPAVESYPTWHPFVAANSVDEYPITSPHRDCGYEGLDHSVFFANAFITCPYGDGQAVIDSVNRLPCHSVALIEAERLDIKLYNSQATPILVTCRWERTLDADGSIPKSLAIPLILEKELPHWLNAQCAESWETMRPYFLGEPCGSRSSLFVNQETGQSIKTIWNALINTGMFGKIRY